jgi:hypothetical protein
MDSKGASSSCTGAVTVVDVTPPVFTFVPPARTISVCVNADIGQAQATDNCGPVVITKNAPAKFPLSLCSTPPTTVIWTATDGAGKKTTASQQVTATLGDDPSCCPNGTNIILGNNASNTIVGTAGSDCILGRGGDDVIDARGGNDFVSGGEGRNNIQAGFGNDTVTAGSGDHIIDLGPGDDCVSSGAGRDTIMAGLGSDSDFVNAGPDVDTCSVPAGGTDTAISCKILF